MLAEEFWRGVQRLDSISGRSFGEECLLVGGDCHYRGKSFGDEMERRVVLLSSVGGFLERRGVLLPLVGGVLERRSRGVLMPGFH